MKALPSTELGSWEQAVMTSDGCWQIRGFFSQNSTFIVRNYLTGALLWYRHVSMWGSDQGISKSAEGYLAACYSKRLKMRDARLYATGRTRTHRQKNLLEKFMVTA